MDLFRKGLVCCGPLKMVDLSKFGVENPQKHQDHVSLHKEFDLKKHNCI